LTDISAASLKGSGPFPAPDPVRESLPVANVAWVAEQIFVRHDPENRVTVGAWAKFARGALS
jgi:hypothetical protein